MIEPFCKDCAHRLYVEHLDQGICTRPLLEIPKDAYDLPEPPPRNVPTVIERDQQAGPRPDYLYDGDWNDDGHKWINDVDHCGPQGKHFQKA